MGIFYVRCVKNVCNHLSQEVYKAGDKMVVVWRCVCFFCRVSMHEVGISNPVRGSDFRACQKQISELVRRLNTEYGEGTVVYEERNISDATLLHRQV